MAGQDGAADFMPADIPASFTPPPRSLLYVRACGGECGDAGCPAVVIGCDCGGVTHLTVEIVGRLATAQEAAFTCDGCQSVHWFTMRP